MPVSIPERTIDAWLAIALADRFPSASIWLPTNQPPEDWDLAFSPGAERGKLVIFECKSATPVPNSPEHRIDINMRQLARYCTDPQLASRTFYVLPQPPWKGSPPAGHPLPEQAGRWRESRQWLQVVEAVELQQYLTARSKSSLRTSELERLQPSSLGTFLGELHECRWGQTWTDDLGEPFGERLITEQQARREKRFPRLFRLPSWRRERETEATSLTPVSVFVPIGDLKARDRGEP